jgi:hypothetical protein
MLAAAIPVLRGDHSRRRLTFLGVAGALAVWVSQPAVFVLAGVAAALLASRVRPLGPLFVVLAIWLASSVAMLAQAQHAIGAADRAYLDAYWAAGFLPLPPHSVHDALWLVRVGRELYQDALPTALPWTVCGVAVIGVAALATTERPIAVLMLATVAAALAASAMRAYPVTGRLALFLVPLLTLAFAAGAAAVVAAARPYQARAALLAAPLVLAPPLWKLRQATFEREDLRTVVQHFAVARRAGDVVYVYYAAQAAFRYYTARLGVTMTPVAIGTCARTDWRAYVADLDRLRGRARVWIVASHLYRGRVDEDSLFTDYPRRLGGPPLAAFTGRDSWARLYDFSDTTAATTRAARAYRPALTGRPAAPAYSCGPQPAVATVASR